jgi:MFS family permease
MSTKDFWIKDMLIYPKILFFTLLFAINACYTYRTKFFEEEFGISAKNYGLIAATLSFVAFCSAPIWSYISDRYRRPKRVLLVASIMEGAGFQLFLLVPPFRGDLTFSLIIAIGAFINCFNAALYPLMDRICLSMVGKDKELYGKQRLWGSLGNISITLLMGFLASKDRFGYTALYWGVGITQMIFLLVGIFLIPADNSKCFADEENDQFQTVKAIKEEEKKEKEILEEANRENPIPTLDEKQPPVLKRSQHLKMLLTNKLFLFYLLIALMNGICKAIGSHFMNHFLEDKNGLGASKPIVALASNSANAMEIVFFFLSKSISERIGLTWMVLLAQVAMGIRMAIHSFLPRAVNGESPVWVLGLAVIAEAIKGLSFGSMTSSGVLLAAREAPKEVQATAQGLFSGVFIGLAPSLAGVLGFVLMTDNCDSSHWFGDHQGLFRVALLLSLLAFIMLSIRFAFFEKPIPEKKQARPVVIKKTQNVK